MRYILILLFLFIFSTESNALYKRKYLEEPDVLLQKLTSGENFSKKFFEEQADLIWDLKWLFEYSPNKSNADKIISYWKITDELTDFRKKNYSNSDKRVTAYKLRRSIDVAFFAVAKESEEARQMIYDAYKKESDSSRISELRGLYVKSGKNITKSAFELWDLKDIKYNRFLLKDLDFALEEVPCMFQVEMTKDVYLKLRDYILIPISNGIDLLDRPLALKVLSSEKLVLKFEDINRYEYDKMVLNLHFESARSSYVEHDFMEAYHFGKDDKKDKLWLDNYIYWYRLIEDLIPNLSLYNIEEVRNVETKGDAFINMTKILVLSNLKDKAVKSDLKLIIKNETNPVLKAYYIDIFGNIAENSDILFLEELSKDNFCLKIREGDLDIYRNRHEYREEIYPIKEAAERILKKLNKSTK